jgi:catechol 2,3-dioxygenase-like lactoylglutathione lyase family enzyme
VIIDHLKIGVSDLDASRHFYAQALEPRLRGARALE